MFQDKKKQFSSHKNLPEPLNHDSLTPIYYYFMTLFNDQDPQETQEWIDAWRGVFKMEGSSKAHFLVDQLIQESRQHGIDVPFSANTPYINTIPHHLEPSHPGNREIEERLKNYLRWNSMAMVVKANRHNPIDGGDLGGHISSYASIATLLETGFNHFWKGDQGSGGDLLYIQGHSSPGIYARAFLEGRLDEDHLNSFRQEVSGRGLSSYPHPHLMPNFWQFPTVSMGLGPLMAIYQARFLKYLHARKLADTQNRKVWAFCGDGEMDEPESLGAIGVAAREKLDNLIFVVNCNLQRLDGPVRGNGKIIQELEAEFRGAGWNVIKVIWGSSWDKLLDQDRDGLLKQVMMDTLDGEYQSYKAHDGAFAREHFFGKNPELAKRVESWSDDAIWNLSRGGHDDQKVYAAYHSAVHHQGQPTVILVKTVKGFGMGKSGEAKNTAHQTKKLSNEDLMYIRDRFNIPISDESIESIPFIKPAPNTPEHQYLMARRQDLGGPLPWRRTHSDEQLKTPNLDQFEALLTASPEGRENSTTQSFVRCLTPLLRDPVLGERIVPILVDEARTFGMEGLFRQIGIYAPEGQKYTPVDKDQVMFYREDRQGQILQEGINEAGGIASWIAAATSYSTSNKIMIPFYIFYSMFGLQRVGDFIWAAADMQARGFLLGGTSGRTTLNGEGLQHEDGHSQLIASTIPNCLSYDPTFAHEVAVIIQDGLKRMIERQENVFYYLTLLNENYAHPGIQSYSSDHILKGMYQLYSQSEIASLLIEPIPDSKGNVVNTQNSIVNLNEYATLLGSGSILRESIAAKKILLDQWGIHASVWSCPSFNELARDGLNTLRHNRFNPDALKQSFVESQLIQSQGPIVASTDYVRALPEQIRAFIPKDRTFEVLGTDGFGRSDFRYRLRDHFEINRYHIVLSVLSGLYREGRIESKWIYDAMEYYAIQSDRPNPIYS